MFDTLFLVLIACTVCTLVCRVLTVEKALGEELRKKGELELAYRYWTMDRMVFEGQGEPHWLDERCSWVWAEQGQSLIHPSE